MTSTEPDWALLIQQIKAGDPEGMATLYSFLNRSFRFRLLTRLGHVDIDEHIHEVLLILVDATRRSNIRKAEAFPGFVRTIVNRYAANKIDDFVACRKHSSTEELQEEGHAPVLKARNPEEQAIYGETLSRANHALQNLRSADREVMRRAFLKEERPATTCEQMNLTETQYRLRKSRAKAKVLAFVSYPDTSPRENLYRAMRAARAAAASYRMGLSQKTVATHKRVLKLKLSVSNDVALVKYGIRNGLTTF
jgi:RNA polymerase sigma-70 factor (ECF subfamily)